MNVSEEARPAPAIRRSHEAFEKLRVIATEVFAEAPKGTDHIDAKDPTERP